MGYHLSVWGYFYFEKKTFVGERDWHLKSLILSYVRF